MTKTAPLPPVLPAVVPRQGLPTVTLGFLLGWLDGWVGRDAGWDAVEQIRVAGIRLARLPGMAEEPELVYRWAGLVGGAPDVHARSLLLDLIGAPTVMPRWLALGADGPLAYAAGLNLTEATEVVTSDWTGPVAREDATVLAALRGWAFPPLP